MADIDRKAEIAHALANVQRRINRACDAAGRDPADVTLLAVTKTYPASDAALLVDLGITQLAENRTAEAETKATELSSLRPNLPIQWSMVGRLQRNKAASVVRWANEVQSVDSSALIDALRNATRTAIARQQRTTPLEVSLQVSLDGDVSRGGTSPEHLVALGKQITQSDELRLRGVMAIAPLRGDPAHYFRNLADIARNFQKVFPQATEISAGMSGDLEQAITYGATRVRVGTALLGNRGLASP